MHSDTGSSILAGLVAGNGNKTFTNILGIFIKSRGTRNDRIDAEFLRDQ